MDQCRVLDTRFLDHIVFAMNSSGLHLPVGWIDGYIGPQRIELGGYVDDMSVDPSAHAGSSAVSISMFLLLFLSLISSTRWKAN